MADDASVASFRSLSANAGRSLNEVSRSSLFLRRHQQQQRGSSPPSGRRVVGRGAAPGPSSSSRPSTSSSISRRSYLNVMDDVRAWEEAKARERVEARLREEEAKREEAREREARARAAEEEEASERAVELERREAEQRELRQRLAKEQEARIEAAAQLAEMQRLENERLRRELAERERLEEERLAAASLLERRRRLEEEEEEEARKASAEFSPPSARADGGRRPSRGAREEQGDVFAEDATVVSELTDLRGPDSPAAEAAGTAAFEVDDGRGHKIKRSASTRSLHFASKGDGRKSRNDQSPAAADGPQPPPPPPFAIASIEDVDFDDPAATRALLMRPCPRRDGVVQLVVRRNKGLKNALSPEYRVYLRSGSGKTETFLMTSKKRAFASKTSSYLISMSRNDHDKKSESVLGKLRSNFLGTEYVIYDGGKNPEFDDAYYDESNGSDEVRCELGAVLYAPNTSLGAKSPRKMRVFISRVDGESGEPLRVWQPRDSGSDEDRLIPAVKEAREEDKVCCFHNKPPTWSDEAGAYVLNFNGRVTMASVKNFQLLDGEEEQVLQFGRVGKDEFSMDVQWPLSLFQAFAVCLSSFDSKLGCD